MSSIRSMWAEKKAKNHRKFAVLTSDKKLPIFWHILDVFSAQDDPIELKPFPSNQASRDTSLEYQQGILWSTLKFQYFWLWPPLRGPKQKYFWPENYIYFNKKGGMIHPIIQCMYTFSLGESLTNECCCEAVFIENKAEAYNVLPR